MSRIGPWGIPGTGAAQFSVARNIFWGGDDSRLNIRRVDAVVRSSTVDAGNTPTSAIRPGLLLGQNTADTKLVPWDPAAVDGTENLYGINEQELVMTDAYGTAVDRACGVVVQAPMEAASLLIKGVNLVGATDEYLARRYLALMGCLLDDDPTNWLSGLVPRNAIKSANYTILATDNGTRFVSITANTTYTLPALKAGLRFEFIRSDAFTLSVASAEGDNMIVGNDASADSVTWSTAGNQVGAAIAVEGRYINGTLKWVPTVLAVPFSTGTLLTQTLAT